MTALAPVRPIFRAFVCTVVPDADQLDEKGWQELEALADSALRDRPPAMLRQLRLFLRLIQWLSILRHGRGFPALRPEERTRILVRLQDHRVQLIRCGFWGLRTIAFLGFYGRAEASRAIGYAPNPRGWEALR